MDNRPIGVFDSGFGGLTVLKEIKSLLPDENIIYFGDNGRTPYGTKSKEVIQKFTLQNTSFLSKQDIKMLVIACNTASAYSLEVLKDRYFIPMVEVIKPGALAAVRETRNSRVGIIATTATIASGVYEKAIKDIDKGITTFSKACPLFVNLVEEGWWDNEIARLTAKEYLGVFKNTEIDTLIMGCTHYPLLENIISDIMGNDVELVSSAKETAKIVAQELDKLGLKNNKNQATYTFFTSDSAEKFAELGSMILGEKIKNVSKADIEKF